MFYSFSFFCKRVSVRNLKSICVNNEQLESVKGNTELQELFLAANQLFGDNTL